MDRNALRRLRFLASCFILFLIQPASGRAEKPPGRPLLVMCQPTLRQILNIEEMAAQGLISVKPLALLGVFHETDEAEVHSAIEYVRAKRLDWIQFRPIRGKVVRTDLFRPNLWTEQFREIVENSDGILFTGGADIPPSLYGQESSLLADSSSPERCLYEVSFLFHLIGGDRNRDWVPFLETRRGYPVLAVCLGCQTLNVAAGGTLVQDIPSRVYGLDSAEQVLRLDRDRIHSGDYAAAADPGATNLAPAVHRIRIMKGSLLAAETTVSPDPRPYVLTAHHQAIDRLGRDLFVTALSMDGKIVEAVEHRRYPNVLGVQFHPENFVLYRSDILFRRDRVAEPDLNLRSFLEADPASMELHRRLWKWFSSALAR